MSFFLLLALVAFIVGIFTGVPRVSLVPLGLASLTVWLAWPHLWLITF